MHRSAAFVLILVMLATAVGIFVVVSPRGGSDRRLTGGPGDAPVASVVSAVPPRVATVLATIKETDRGALAVSEEDGRLLRILVSSSRSQNALEIGAASGYSAIWIGLGLRETAGHLTTIEYNAGRAREAADNVERAGLSDVVTVVAGDAFQEIPKLEGTFDFVFLDAWKKDYRRFFDLVTPRLDRGGLLLAHNVVNKRSEMPDFLAAIQSGPAFETVIMAPSGEGMSISYKRR
jgi:predicted O-methyltransferase YrrM